MNRKNAEDQLNEVCKMFSVSDVYELASLHLKHDQDSVHQEIYDLDDLSLIHNRIKDALLSVELTNLKNDEKRVVKSILWLWYHHATTIAIWQKKDLELAKEYCKQALTYLYPEHPNRITPMLCMLLHNELKDAQKWAREKVGDNERSYAEYLLEEYKKGTFVIKPPTS